MLFFLLLVLLPALALAADWVAPIAVFYKAGALVFGGGHVVLPLLQAGVVPPGWVSNEVFLAGYGAAQAVPGPLFTFAAYLGAVMPAPLGGWSGAAVLLSAIFLPAFLLVVGALPFWEALRQRGAVRRAMGGINAQVFASKYLTDLPAEDELRAEVEKTRRALASHPPPLSE